MYFTSERCYLLLELSCFWVHFNDKKVISCCVRSWAATVTAVVMWNEGAIQQQIWNSAKKLIGLLLSDCCWVFIDHTVKISVLYLLKNVSRFRNWNLSHKLFSLALGRGEQCQKIGYGFSGHRYSARRIVLNAILSLYVTQVTQDICWSIEWWKENREATGKWVGKSYNASVTANTMRKKPVLGECGMWSCLSYTRELSLCIP